MRRKSLAVDERDVRVKTGSKKDKNSKQDSKGSSKGLSIDPMRKSLSNIDLEIVEDEQDSLYLEENIQMARQ